METLLLSLTGATVKTLVFAVFLLCFFAAFFWFIYSTIRGIVRYVRFRHAVYADLPSEPAIPMGVDLRRANQMLRALKEEQRGGLLSAAILQLVNLGAFVVRPSATGGTERLQVVDFAQYAQQPVLLRRVYDVFRAASRQDGTLDDADLRDFMTAKQNARLVDSLALQLQDFKDTPQFTHSVAEVRRVLSLRRYLCELSVASVSSHEALQLCREHIVWATLFGIQRQVLDDIAQLSPRFFSADPVAAQMGNAALLPALCSAADYAIGHYERPASAIRDRYERTRR